MDWLERDVKAIMTLLRTEFGKGVETVSREAPLTAASRSGGHLADVIHSVWFATKDRPGAIDEAVFDLVETANCVFESGFSDITAGQPTGSHGTLREIVMAAPVPAS
jgi:hypothetical protein